MSGGVGLTLVYFLTVCSCIYSTPNIYGSYYGYTPYMQYYPGQSSVYSPYPYYVSNQNFPYYGYPVQPQPPLPYPYSYPAQNYYTQTYQPVYPVQQTYSQPQYSASEPVHNTTTNATDSTSSSSNINQIGTDQYANIKTEIIDIEPKYFNYYKKFFHLENNTSPGEVVENRNNVVQGGNRIQAPYYTVKTQSRSYNVSTKPNSYSTHDVKSKTYSFKRTFTIDPNNKNSVVRLNFVNGVQITTTPEPSTIREDEAATEYVETEGSTTTQSEELARYAETEAPTTTTESEVPANILSWV